MSTKIPAPPATFNSDSIMTWGLAAEEAIRPLRGTARFNAYLDLVELADTFTRRAGSLERCEVSFLYAVRSVANRCANGAAVGTHPGVRGLAAAWSEQSWSFLVSECKANGWTEPTRLAGNP
jgi:hypothetical protein